MLGEKKIRTLLWELSVPAILGMLSTAIFNVVDRYFVGKINPLALSGVGITMPIQVLQMAIVFLIGIGSSTLVSIRLGEGKKDEAKDILYLSLRYIIYSMALFAIGFVLLQDFVLQKIGVSEQVYPYAQPYILILMLGAVVGMPGYCLSNSLRSMGKAKVAMKAVLYTSVLNMILDPVFIFIFRLGVSGAAIATVISQLVHTIYILGYFTKAEDLPIRLEKRIIESQWRYAKAICAKGSPSFYVQILASAVGMFVNISIVKYGSDFDVAAITIILTIFGLYHMIVFGIVQGNQPIVGYNWGSRQYARVKEALIFSTFCAFLLSLALFLIIQLRPQWLIGIFADDDKLIEMTSHGMRLYFAALPLFSIQVMGAQYFQAIGKSKLSGFLFFLRNGLIIVPTILILAPKLGVQGVYLSNAISDSVAAIVTGYFVIREIVSLNSLIREQKESMDDNLDL